ncbi:FAD-dependent oxidoreductase [Streptomyces sp. NPDC006307]|uniref:FAD-dependent oxidoreductase n=1 Tax=Streptomyces sp. NPDC006307 TaxID=3156748 RepID=UPI0033BD1445
MVTSQTADVVVVGNGVLGLSVAVEIALRAPKTRVAVVGPTGRPMAATAAAGAMLNCFGEVTRYTDRHPVTRARFALAREALDAWPGWMETLADLAGPAVGKALRASYRTGTLVLLGARSGHVAADNFEAMRAAAERYDEPYELLGAADVDGLAPRPDARPLRVLHLHREGAVDARAVLAALEAAASRLGVRLVSGTVRELLAGAGAVRGVRLDGDGDTLTAGTVVLAAGAAGSALAETVLPPGAVPPMLFGTGASLLVQRTTTSGPGARQVMRTPNRAATCGLHVVPMADDGHQYIGATNVITTEPITGAELGSCHSLMRQVCEQFDHDLAFARVQRLMVGARPVPLDCFPLLGPCSLSGLVFATGTYRDGFHCSPALAPRLAATVLDPAVQDTDLQWFTPERMPIAVLTPDEALTDTVDHAVDTMSEQGMQLPFWVDGTPLREWVRRRVERLHEELGQPLALAPELIYPQFLAPKSTDSSCAATRLRRYLDAARTHYAPRLDAPARVSC